MRETNKELNTNADKPWLRNVRVVRPRTRVRTVIFDYHVLGLCAPVVFFNDQVHQYHWASSTVVARFPCILSQEEVTGSIPV